MQRRPAAGRPRRGEHVQGEHRHGEHVEGTAQTAEVSVPQCRRPALLSNPATRRAAPVSYTHLTLPTSVAV